MFTLSKVIAFGITLVFGSLGHNFLPQLFIYLFPQVQWTHSPLVGMVVGVVIGFIVSLFISRPIEKALQRFQDYMATLNVSYIFFGAVGAIIGIVVAGLISLALIAFNLPVLSDVVPLIFVLQFVMQLIIIDLLML